MKSVNQEIRNYGDIMSRYGIIIHSELAHHGIKGQKWGVRRYQNSDGSLTEAGKRRYGNMSDKKLYKTLKKQVRDRRVQYIRETENPKADWSVRWGGTAKSGRSIGPNSKKMEDEYRDAHKKYISTNEYKNWEKKLNAAESWDYDDTYDKRFDDLLNQKPKGQPYGGGVGRVLKNGKWQPMIKGKGAWNYTKKATIAKLKDLGYDDDTAEYFANRIIKNRETLEDI